MDYGVQCSYTLTKRQCSNPEGDLLKIIFGNVLLLLLYDRCREPVTFLFIKNAKDGVCRGVNYTWTNI